MSIKKIIFLALGIGAAIGGGIVAFFLAIDYFDSRNM